MFSDIAIRVQNVTKAYQIYDKPQDRLKQSLWRGRKQFYREFKALDDVSFEVKKGETVGIIGRNGSGKSTLLQIICGTLAPTSGGVEVNGRVAALLELGAGFNPEFSGRENIYLNAAILGLTKKEIDDKYDEIITFANIGDFIEQPVKTYSSGMYVRLAFAIAISVSPDILIVDEALSVGDLNFRNKCMKRIKLLRDAGVTVFFVSHDLGTVQTICDKAIWLNDGKIREQGTSVSVCQNYYAFMTGEKTEQKEIVDIVMQQPSEMAEFTHVSVEAWNKIKHLPTFNIEENINFDFRLLQKEPLGRIVFAVSVYRDDKDWLIGQTSREQGVFWDSENSEISGKLILSPNILAPGNYYAAFAAYSEDLTICYALTDLITPFAVRSDYPVWGKVVAPSQWIALHE
jgi:ABC-type polysaccharide/polyol phosphate transport system ATPase subunit